MVWNIKWKVHNLPVLNWVPLWVEWRELPLHPAQDVINPLVQQPHAVYAPWQLVT